MLSIQTVSIEAVSGTALLNHKQLKVRVIVFRATGSIGKYLVEQALAAGRQVRAFSRNPAAMRITHRNLSLWPGDVFDPSSVAAAIEDCEAVPVALGSTRLSSKVRSLGTKNIVRAMQQHGVKRLVCQTIIEIGNSQADLTIP